MPKVNTDTDYRDDVSAYVDALRDPAGLLDHDRIQELEARRDAAATPSDRLLVMLELRQLRKVDLGPLEAKFIEAVPRYLRDYGLELAEVRDDFLAVGVPPEVLDRVAVTGGAPSAGATKVSVDDVVAHIRGRTGGFTKPDLQRATGASRGTVHKAVKCLVDKGDLVGDDGRPITYTRPRSG